MEEFDAAMDAYQERHDAVAYAPEHWRPGARRARWRVLRGSAPGSQRAPDDYRKSSVRSGAGGTRAR